MHLRPIKIDESVDVDFLSRQTPGFSGADIANVCNEAALIAHETRRSSCRKRIYECGRPYRGGLRKEQDHHARREENHRDTRGRTRYLSWFLEHANPLVKVTIVPRGKALGAAWYLPRSDKSPPRSRCSMRCAPSWGTGCRRAIRGTNFIGRDERPGTGNETGLRDGHLHGDERQAP